MFIIDWLVETVNWTLHSLGLASKSGKILFLGLDNAGKTTLLHKLKDDRLTVHCPTVHPNSEVLEVDNIQFTTYDLGGHQAARKLWKDYFPDVSGVVFIVDGADRQRFPEAKVVLDELLTDDSLAGVPIVVLGNKIDIPSAASETELRNRLGIHNTYGKEISTNRNHNNSTIRPVEIFMCSVVRTTGYADGFKWLAQFI